MIGCIKIFVTEQIFIETYSNENLVFDKIDKYIRNWLTKLNKFLYLRVIFKEKCVLWRKNIYIYI